MPTCKGERHLISYRLETVDMSQVKAATSAGGFLSFRVLVELGFGFARLARPIVTARSQRSGGRANLRRARFPF